MDIDKEVNSWKKFDVNFPPEPGRYLIWDACLPDPSYPRLWTFRPAKLGERWGIPGKIIWFNEQNWPADRAPSHYASLTIPPQRT